MKSTYIVLACVALFIGLHFIFDKPLGIKGKEETIKPIQTTKVPSTKTTKNMDTTTLIIEDEKIGTGNEAKSGDTVTVHYVGTLTNGTIFDASRNRGDTGFTFVLGRGEVIKGWDQGVLGMKVGGTRKLTIPSDLAYGNRAVGGVIPANATLIFEVELLNTAVSR